MDEFIPLFAMHGPLLLHSAYRGYLKLGRCAVTVRRFDDYYAVSVAVPHVTRFPVVIAAVACYVPAREMVVVMVDGADHHPITVRPSKSVFYPSRAWFPIQCYPHTFEDHAIGPHWRLAK
ncbi:MAG: hypothetical protein WCG26_10805 [Chloroflexales bacterium]